MGFSPAVVPFSCGTGLKEIPMSFCFPVRLYLGSARQGQITGELLEIIGGAEALKG